MSHDIVLITRPEQDSKAMRHRLSALDIPSGVAPLLSIKPLKTDYNWSSISEYDGIIITSKHTAIHLNQNIRKENIPLFAIGEETLKSLMYLNFHISYTAQGNSASLKKVLDQYLVQQGDSKRRRFIHFGGAHVSDSFKKHLLDSDLNIDHIPVYDAVAMQEFSQETIRNLQQNQIGIVLFFSSRSALIFEELCAKHDLTDTLKHIQALCLAPSVVKSLNSVKWKRIIASPEPNADAMMTLLKDIYTQECKKNE